MNLRTCQESISTFSRALLICAALVCFAATPAAFAQRGGGGRAGGGHAGGGHFGAVGGAHIGGAARASRGAGGAYGTSGAFRSSAGARANSPRSAYEAAAMQSRSGTSSRGYTREVFVSGSGTGRFIPPSSRFVGANGNTTGIGTHAFAANNYFWEEPPQQARPAPAQTPRPVMPLNQMPRPIMMPAQRPFNAPATPLGRPFMARPIYAPAWHANPLALPVARSMARPLVRPLQRPLSGTSTTANTTPYIGMTPATFGVPGIRPFHPFHPIGGGFGTPCFANIGNCDFGFGFGFGSPFFFSPGFGCAGFFNPCGIGFGFGPSGFGFAGLYYGYGWGNGWFYPPAPEIPPAPVNPTESNPPPDYSTGYFYLPEVPYSEPQAAQQKQTIKLVLKDGTIFDVYSYWAQDNRLFYITTYNIKTSIPLDDLDLQKTVDLNQKLGVTFTLSNKAPDQQQPPQEQ